jgi:bifunctional ADP-heptose synthase (sugar kinase/adenylyltransferase)
LELRNALGLLNTGEFDSQLISVWAKLLRSKTFCENVLVTIGKRGMFVLSGETGQFIPPYGPTAFADTIGAGDTVMAAYSLGIASGLSVQDAAKVANVAGGISVTKRGTSVVSFSEIVEAFSHTS